MDGIDYKTTDGGRWGAGSGLGTDGNLTPTQLDLNFWTLYTRLKDLEDNPPEAINIVGFTIVGSQLQVNMSDGSNLGPYTLPIATFQFRGDWVNDMHYFELDIVVAPDFGLFLVRIAHDTLPSPAVFDPDADDGSGNLLYLKLFGEGPRIYDFGFFFPGQPGNGIATGDYMAAHTFARDVVLPENMAGSVARLRLAPLADLSFELDFNGDSLGTLDFAAGETDGVFTFSATAFVAGDTFGILPPASVDDDARQLTVTFVGTRGTL